MIQVELRTNERLYRQEFFNLQTLPRVGEEVDLYGEHQWRGKVLRIIHEDTRIAIYIDQANLTHKRTVLPGDDYDI